MAVLFVVLAGWLLLSGPATMVLAALCKPGAEEDRARLRALCARGVLDPVPALSA